MAVQTPTGAINYTHANANGATSIKTGAGLLAQVTINTKGATGNTLTIYDNTAASGTVIAVIDTTSQVTTLIFDVGFTVGLTIALATGTAADITVAWL
jgi:hypothetical protein